MDSPFGRFSTSGTEYVIDAPFAPPRAQLNFLWNKSLISAVNQFGSGDGAFNNQTLTLNDPRGRVRLIRDGRRYFYVRDCDSGELWNVGLFPIRPEGASHIARVGLGYSTFETAHRGVTVESTVFLASDEAAELWQFAVSNRGDSPRRLWLTPYVEWLLGGYPVFSSPYSYLRSQFDPVRRAVLSFNTSDERPHDHYHAFLATDGEVAGWSGGRRDFLGPYGSPSAPRALLTGEMPDREAWCEELAGSLAIIVELAPGATRQIGVSLGSFDTLEAKDRIIAKTRDPDYRAAVRQRMADEKRAMIECVQVATPSEAINRLTNVWAKQQIQLCAEFGRDGARGFRDTLQDAWAAIPFNASLASTKIKETLAHQYSDGHAIRGWMPIQAHHYSDGPCWIAPAVCAYLKETGDRALLDEVVPYLDGGRASVLDHLLVGLRHLSEDLGTHGLVLAHEGDWNDSLNWMGREGRGESVWTSMALFHSLGLVAEMATELLDAPALCSEMELRAATIRHAIQTFGWDGSWYLAGYSDDGTPVGSHRNAQGRVFLNTQTWAILTGLATGPRLEACLAAIDNELESTHGSLTLAPAFTEADS
ncbi:MAG: hypothetical protein KDA61_00920, partial [Planctomycetales bacterium]|nr:hypothetical protein [Planctomycetales bacterium]